MENDRQRVSETGGKLVRVELVRILSRNRTNRRYIHVCIHIDTYVHTYRDREQVSD